MCWLQYFLLCFNAVECASTETQQGFFHNFYTARIIKTILNDLYGELDEVCNTVAKQKQSVIDSATIPHGYFSYK